MLSWFRRHAKVLMVVLGSAAMAIFGLGPVFDTLANRAGGGSQRSKEVVATWNGGEITRTDLDLMGRQHYQSQRFLAAVREAAEKKKGDVVNTLVLPIAQIQGNKQELIDEQLITRFLLAERGKQEGMVVSDGMVNDYLAMLSGDAGFSNRDLESINDSVNNRRCSLQSVRERLKTELLYNQMQLCTMAAVPMVPNPVESMELYGRTVEQIECEVLPIEVENYIGKLDVKPNAAELKRIYEEGKFEFADPTGERPGFKVSRKVNLQYLVADYETYLQNEVNKLSNEEVQKEYERLVEEESELVMEPIVPEDDSIEIDVTPSDDEPDAETEGGTNESADDSEAPSDVTPPPSSEESTEGSGDPSNDESSEDDASDESGCEGSCDEDDQSLSVRSNKYQFVSTAVQEDEKEEPAETAVEIESAEQVVEASEPAEPAEMAGDAETNSEGNSEGENSEGENSEGENSEGEEAAEQEGEIGGIGDIMEDADAINAEEEKIVRTAKPLKDVAMDVKRSMAEPAAIKAMTEALTKASVIVQDHFEKRLRWDSRDNKKGEEPAPLDHAALAKKYNLTAKESGLVDDVEIAQDPMGQVRVYMTLERQGRQVPQLVPVGQLVFTNYNDMQLYNAQTVNDNWGNKSSYLFWLSEKTPARIPTFEECRPAVEKFWKSQKALELAMKEADSIKSKVNGAGGKKLTELYADRASSTGSFTWFSNFGSTRYGNPIGVTSPGGDFMKTAFSLASHEAGVAMNSPKDIIYVVQAITESKGVESVGTDYLENQYFKYKKIPTEVMRVARLYLQEFSYDWNQEFSDEMGLKFLDR